MYCHFLVSDVFLKQRKINDKSKIGTIKSQQIRESFSVQRINEWVEKRRRRRREWDEHITRMEAERLVKISRDNKPAEINLQDARKEDRST